MIDRRPACAGPRRQPGWERAARSEPGGRAPIWVDPRLARIGRPRRSTRSTGRGPRLTGIVAIALVSAVAAACGGGSLDSSTVQLQDGTEVSAQRYLADTSAAAVALTEFTATLDALGEDPTVPQMQAAANALAGPLSDAEIAAQRLSAARLVDTRLEEQRSEAARWTGIAVVRMTAVLAAAEGGDVDDLRDAAADYAEALEGLRAAGESSLEGG